MGDVDALAVQTTGNGPSTPIQKPALQGGFPACLSQGSIAPATLMFPASSRRIFGLEAMASKRR